jgi:hypothetical protein
LLDVMFPKFLGFKHQIFLFRLDLQTSVETFSLSSLLQHRGNIRHFVDEPFVPANQRIIL